MNVKPHGPGYEAASVALHSKAPAAGSTASLPLAFLSRTFCTAREPDASGNKRQRSQRGFVNCEFSVGPATHPVKGSPPNAAEVLEPASRPQGLPECANIEQ
ncbi:hypothetical protein PSCLAVI8L_240002 [Pseudoclavibacter sp. 8L]|nr:hypothetical protein PSCLAVI8L_240002 [Pseudoclavibacter sp. 8L]